MGPAPSLFKILFSAVGRDIQNLSLPCSVMEPLGILQIMCGDLEYSELIDEAIASQDPVFRTAFVAALAVSSYEQSSRRAGRKPFNPLLGETYEFEHPNRGWKYVAEQVSHHPSVSACHAEARGWTFWQDRQFFVTFGGSSAEAKSVGVVYLHLNRWNETYRRPKVTSNVTGLMSGRPMVDHYGELVIGCDQTKMTAKLHFKKMSKHARGEIVGKALNEDAVVEKLQGNWTDSLYLGEGSTKRRLWHVGSSPSDSESEKYFEFSRFAWR